MCLYPKLIQNKKYQPNKKNNYNPPVCTDERLRYVTASCGHCLECRQQRARGWQVRMCEELKDEPNAIFVTLTIDDEKYKKLSIQAESKDNNTIATKAIRLFLERVRKKTKKSIRHWFITELGHNKTERLHLHGIIWGINAREAVKEWGYGFTYIGEYVNEKTITYVVKYMTKPDTDHKEFEGKVLCSGGIGSGYINRINSKNNKFNGEETNETYRLKNGAKINLPIYYRNKIYSEEEKEELWKQKIDKGEIYVCGEKMLVENYEEYNNALKYHRERAARIHYDNPQEWEERIYKQRLKKQRDYREKERKRKI